MVVQDNHSQDLVSSPLKNDKKHRLKQRFDVQKKLGQGTYGKVQLAVNRETGQEVAIKTIKKVKIESEQDLIRIRREIQIMSSIQHPHIIHIYEVFENKDKIVLVMQFASGGELYDYLSEKKVLSDLEARRVFRQIAAAVYYCHKNKICHRDLKLENILLDEKGNAKIADFGLSNVFDERHLLKTYCGSPLYASPEIVKGVPYYGPEVDCWSMGVLLYTLVYGAMPFDGSNFKKLVTQISEGDYFEPKKKSKASGLIRKLLTVNPVKRATIVDICTDYWVNQGYEHSLLQVAEDMANLTPVRLDLLLALAPVSPIPPHESELQEQRDVEGTDSNTAPDNSIPEKDTEEEEEQEDDDEDDDDNPETMANSFAYVRGSHTSNLSASSPNLPEASTRFDDEEDEFLPVDIAAALQSQCSKRCAERSFDGSLVRISSLAHKSKKPRKSDSSTGVKNNKTDTKVGGQAASNSNIHTERLDKENSNNVNEKSNEVQCMQEVAQNKHTLEKINSEDSSKAVDSQENVNKSLKATARNNDKSSELLKSSSNVQKTGIIQEQVSIKQNVENKDSQKTILPSNCNERKKSLDILQKRDSFSTQKDKPELEAKKMGRHPGKIIIPKTFDSPQSTPSPKLQGVKKLSPDVKENSSETKIINVDPKVQTGEKLELLNKADTESDKDDSPKENELIDFNEENTHNITETEPISEEKKTLAKGILKKGIAKAKLAERKLSQQSSIESEVLTPPTSSIHTPDGGPPSFFKAPKPYSKEEKPHIKSKAEIIFTPSVKRTNSVKSDDTLRNTNSSIWDTASFSKDKQMQNKDLSWSAISSTLDSEMSNWREQMEESLRRLSPDEDEKSPSPVNNSKNDDDKPLVPIARSYKKFTFTKDGACITETKKIYATPCADGSWTKVEKKTKITTRPGNAEEFEKFRDLHLRNDSPLTRSDSQSSSGSNEMYDDIFDSWTGDTALCNVMKMKNLFQKFSRDPFLRTERRRNPFRQFRRTESERNDRTRRRTELRSGHSTDRESSDNEEDYDVHFDGSNPIVYGSQGLWQLLRSANKGFPGRVTVTHHDPLSYSRSVSQDRSESKLSNWKQNESRASSGYNTGSRCHSRDRTQSPREKVLRFVFETPTQENAKGSGSKSPPSKQDSWSFRRNSSRHNPRRDSGVTSDGYESEHSVRRIPSDDLSKSGRVSPLSSIYSGGRHDMIRDFVRSWSKDMGSPPGSPSSFHQDAANEKTSNLADSRRHRVEQWLQMNDINNPNFPFGFHGDRHSIMSSRKPSAHSNTSSSYATMRPREYMRYNRSSSDKIPDHDIDYFPSFEESHRSTSTHNLQNKESGSLSEASKAKARTLYSPVSEESSKETHSLRHSDSSHSGSSMHRINFTISDGRISSSHTPPPTRYVQAFSDPTGGQTVVSSRSGNVKVEQVPARSPGQPLVQMRVSFNRGNRDNQVVHVTSQLPQESKGLWQHQDPQNNARTLNIQNTSNRETSPVPGIRKFSTEMVHSVGIAAEGQNVSDVRQKRHSNIENSSTSSLEYEVKSVGRSSSDSLHKGKNNDNCSPTSFCSDKSHVACPIPCMENAVKITNINLTPCYSQTATYVTSSKNSCNEVRKFPNTFFSNGANTPDSLEDLSIEKSLLDLCPENEQFPAKIDHVANYKSATTDMPSHDKFQLEIKPLGVLWDSCDIKNAPESIQIKQGFEPVENRGVTSLSKASEYATDAKTLQNKSFANATSEVGSIWNQKNDERTFDLFNGLLLNDDMDCFTSANCMLNTSNSKRCRNETIQQLTESENAEIFNKQVTPQSLFESHLSVIGDFGSNESRQREKFCRIMPSLMDDLQSPKEVLRQAMRICESFETCE